MDVLMQTKSPNMHTDHMNSRVPVYQRHVTTMTLVDMLKGKGAGRGAWQRVMTHVTCYWHQQSTRHQNRYSLQLLYKAFCAALQVAAFGGGDRGREEDPHTTSCESRSVVERGRTTVMNSTTKRVRGCINANTTIQHRKKG